MKICIIANGYPNSREPQWGCFERDQALALKKAGHDVAILFVDKRFRTYWRKIGYTSFREDGIDVYGFYLIPTQWIRRLWGNKPQYWLASRLLNLVYKKYFSDYGSPDVIYSHYLENIAYSVYLREKYDVPLVGIEHWSAVNKERLSVTSKFRGNIAYNNVDRLLSVSQSLRSKIYKHFKKESTVVYNMLGPEFMASNVNATKTRLFSFVSIGSLVSIKDYEMLIKAFSESNLTLERCTLSIVGDGTERQKLERLIEELNLKDSVFLLGRKTKDEIISLLSESHIYVLSSKSETFGVACIEALSQGLPAIATKCGGPEEFINKRNGLLVPINDISSMAEAMKKMYNDYKNYDTVAIAEECKSRFSPMVIARQLTDIFEDVINRE